MALPIYLDYNATTPVLPLVFEAMAPWLRNNFGNAGCSHFYGEKAKNAIARARCQVAELLDAAPEEVYFTSGGTESNNLATIGVLNQLPNDATVVISTFEHPAIVEPAALLKSQGYEVRQLPVDTHGLTDPSKLSALLTGPTGLVSIMHSNNEVGTIQPIEAIADIAHRSNYFVHTDASQSVGKIPVSVTELGVDLLTIAGHKLYAPKGIGALYVRTGTPIGPVIRGAGQENGLRPGTQPVASIVGLGAACELAKNELAKRERSLQFMRDLLHQELEAGIPNLRLHGHPTKRLPNTLNLSFPRVTGTALLAACPAIAASTGSACHEHGEEPSAVLSAMNIPTEQALGAVRLTLGSANTAENVVQAAKAIISAWESIA